MKRLKKISPVTTESFRKAMSYAIKERRESLGISQLELAEAIEKPQPRVSDIEANGIKSIDTFIACISVLGGQLKIEWKD